MDVTNSGHSPESLASGVLDSHRALARDRYRFLIRLREFDLHRAYKGVGRGPRGSVDTPAWLQSTCGIPQDEAREQLRVAYTLLNLPRIDAAFEVGDLSYTKVKALASVATYSQEASLLALAHVMSDAQVKDYCVRLCRGRLGQTGESTGESHRSALRPQIYSAPISAEDTGAHAST
ncbi:MAG: hypothetical protein OXH15_10355 [Gammaproteobacteria bacterium]|nr:hypothetical protein [Gammaproteobacteria bacterium]